MPPNASRGSPYGDVANRVAAACRQFIVALTNKLRRVTSWLWATYKRVETHLAELVAEILLLIWAVRIALILGALEVALIYVGFRVWWCWIIAFVLGTFIVSATRETIRDTGGTLKHASADFWPKVRIILIAGVRLLVRSAIVLIGLYVSLQYVRPREMESLLRNAHAVWAGAPLSVPSSTTPITNSRETEAAPQEQVKVFSTDFTRGLAGWETKFLGVSSGSATWELILNKGPRWEATGGTEYESGKSLALRSNVSASDVSVTADFAIVRILNERHHAGVVARFVDDRNYYELYINGANRRLLLSRIASGKTTHIAIAEVHPNDLEAPIRLQLTCEGPTLRALLNGRVMFTVEDTANNRGQVGLSNASGATQFSYFGIRPNGA